MRLITFILSSGVALTWIPACASAQSNNTFSQASVSTITCPKHEGYPDCAQECKSLLSFGVDRGGTASIR